MPHSSDSSDSSSFSHSSFSSKQESSDDMRKVQRREKNRIAAQKSRQRQTQKADTLHVNMNFAAQPMWTCYEKIVQQLEQESEDLERQNAALRREIKQLTEELKHFSTMLTSHETHCSILHTQPSVPSEVIYTPLSFHQTHISSPCFQH